MKIDRISFEELFPTGAYANQRLRAEIVLEDTDDPIKAFLLAKELVYKAFEQTKPQIEYASIPCHPMYSEPSKISNQELDAAQRERDIETYHQIINMKGASVKYLEAHRSAIEKLNDEALTQAFNNKINTLQ